MAAAVEARHARDRHRAAAPRVGLYAGAGLGYSNQLHHGRPDLPDGALEPARDDIVDGFVDARA